MKGREKLEESSDIQDLNSYRGFTNKTDLPGSIYILICSTPLNIMNTNLREKNCWVVEKWAFCFYAWVSLKTKYSIKIMSSNLPHIS